MTNPHDAPRYPVYQISTRSMRFAPAIRSARVALCNRLFERIAAAEKRAADAEAQVAEADFNFGGWRAIKKRLEAQVAALEEHPETANKELALWRSEHDPCPFALENERLTEQVRVLSQAEELLGDVSHLWLDGYISKNPKSAAPKEISEEVFAKVTSYLRTAGIEVDYTGWSRIAARSSAIHR